MHRTRNGRLKVRQQPANQPAIRVVEPHQPETQCNSSTPLLYYWRILLEVEQAHDHATVPCTPACWQRGNAGRWRRSGESSSTLPWRYFLSAAQRGRRACWEATASRQVVEWMAVDSHTTGSLWLSFFVSTVLNKCQAHVARITGPWGQRLAYGSVYLYFVRKRASTSPETEERHNQGLCTTLRNMSIRTELSEKNKNAHLFTTACLRRPTCTDKIPTGTSPRRPSRIRSQDLFCVSCATCRSSPWKPPPPR